MKDLKTARNVGALLAVAAVTAPAAADAATWSKPVTVDRGRGPARVETPVVVPGANGASTAAWVRRTPGGSALVGRIGSLRSARYVTVHSSRRRIADPTLLASSGSALFAWRWSDGDAWRVRTRAASTRTLKAGPLQTLTLASPSAGPPSFIGGSGGVRLAWLRGTSSPDLEVAKPASGGRFPGTVRYQIPGLTEADATLSPAGGLIVAYTKAIVGEDAPRVTVATQGANGLRDVAAFGDRDPAADPSVAVDVSGRVVVAWTELVNGVSQNVVVATRARGEEEFSEPRVLASGVLAGDVKVVPKSDGAVLVSWLEEDAAVSPDSPPRRLMVASVTGGKRQISRPGDYAELYGVSVDGRGAAHFAYRADLPGAGGALRVATVGSGEVVGLPRTVTSTGERARSFSIGASTGGALAVAWASGDGREIRMVEKR